MRKIIFIFCLLIVFGFGSNVFAATKARTASMDNGIMSVDGIADISSGDTAEVDENGNLAVELYDNANGLDIDSDGSISIKEYSKKVIIVKEDSYLLGACKIYSIHMSGSAAGDYAYIYDAITTTSGKLRYRLRIGTAVDTMPPISIPGGATFNTAVYVDLKDNQALNGNGNGQIVTIVYDD